MTARSTKSQYFGNSIGTWNLQSFNEQFGIWRDPLEAYACSTWPHGSFPIAVRVENGALCRTGLSWRRWEEAESGCLYVLDMGAGWNAAVLMCSTASSLLKLYSLNVSYSPHFGY